MKPTSKNDRAEQIVGLRPVVNAIAIDFPADFGYRCPQCGCAGACVVAGSGHPSGLIAAFNFSFRVYAGLGYSPAVHIRYPYPMSAAPKQKTPEENAKVLNDRIADEKYFKQRRTIANAEAEEKKSIPAVSFE